MNETGTNTDTISKVIAITAPEISPITFLTALKGDKCSSAILV